MCTLLTWLAALHSGEWQQQRSGSSPEPVTLSPLPAQVPAWWVRTAFYKLQTTHPYTCGSGGHLKSSSCDWLSRDTASTLKFSNSFFFETPIFPVTDRPLLCSPCHPRHGPWGFFPRFIFCEVFSKPLPCFVPVFLALILEKVNIVYWGRLPCPQACMRPSKLKLDLLQKLSKGTI